MLQLKRCIRGCRNRGAGLQKARRDRWGWGPRKLEQAESKSTRRAFLRFRPRFLYPQDATVP